MDILLIDPEAKTKIPLINLNKGPDEPPVFIGKIQWPGSMEFEHGISFMIFLADKGCEELQIAPLDSYRRNRLSRDVSTISGGSACKAPVLSNGRFSIDLHPMVDKNGDNYYVGESIGPSKIDVRHGIFFQIFITPGEERLQISRLQIKPRVKKSNKDENSFDPKRYAE
jgi:hypothetical protein